MDRQPNPKWRSTVLARDGALCNECGSTERIEVHHILSWSTHPDRRDDPDNGVPLCYDCHLKVHGRRHHVGEKKQGLYRKAVVSLTVPQLLWLRSEEERLGITIADLVRRIVDKARGAQ